VSSIKTTLLLSFLPPFYIVVLNREIVYKYIFSSQSAMSTSKKDNTTSEDVNIDKLRERSKLLSLNTLRESLAHSDLSSVLYMDRIKAKSEDSIWANQTEQEFSTVLCFLQRREKQ